MESLTPITSAKATITPPPNPYVKKMPESPPRPVPVLASHKALYTDLRASLKSITDNTPPDCELLKTIKASIPEDLKDAESFLRLARDIDTLLSQILTPKALL